MAWARETIATAPSRGWADEHHLVRNAEFQLRQQWPLLHLRAHLRGLVGRLDFDAAEPRAPGLGALRNQRLRRGPARQRERIRPGTAAITGTTAAASASSFAAPRRTRRAPRRLTPARGCSRTCRSATSAARSSCTARTSSTTARYTRPRARPRANIDYAVAQANEILGYGGEDYPSGWQQDGECRYWYANGDGTWPTGWAKIGGAWYFFDECGYMRAGWLSDGGKWYFLNDEHDGTFGAMVTGWREISGKWYYFTPSGAMATGWRLRQRRVLLHGRGRLGGAGQGLAAGRRQVVLAERRTAA